MKPADLLLLIQNVACEALIQGRIVGRREAFAEAAAIARSFKGVHKLSGELIATEIETHTYIVCTKAEYSAPVTQPDAEEVRELAKELPFLALYDGDDPQYVQRALEKAAYFLSKLGESQS